MDFYEVIETRRSVRSYRSDPIPDDVLKRVLNAARIAPSGNNRQPWKFVVVKDEAIKQDLVPAMDNQRFVAEAPIIISACGCNIHANRGGYMGDLSMLVDVTIAMDHLILAARAEGLGTCWVCAFDNKEVKKILNIPADFQVVAITPLGYPQGERFQPVKFRKPLAEIICVDKFSSPFPL
jgi:nitroreductase